MENLINANDVYKLFGQKGIATLHVADIDQIKRVYVGNDVCGTWNKYMDDKFCGYGADGRIQYRKVRSYECDRCGYGTAVKSNFCPNCGARVDK